MGGGLKLKSGTLIGGTTAGNAKILPHPIYPSSPYEGARDAYMEKRHCFIKWADARSGASGEEPTCQCRGWKRCGFNPLVGKIPWRRKWQPTLVFLPGKFHDRRVLRTVVHGVAKSWTWPKACINTHTHTHTHTHARNPILYVFTKQGWRRKWQPTPVFLPRESHGKRNLAGYFPRSRKSWTQLSN